MESPELPFSSARESGSAGGAGALQRSEAASDKQILIAAIWGLGGRGKF